MNKQSMLCRAGAALVISLSCIGSPILPALSQSSEADRASQRFEADGTAYLFDGADCTTSGSSYLSKTAKSNPNSTVSVARQVYDPLFYMQAAGENIVTLSCRAKPGYGVLVLEMGVPDLSERSEIELNVRVYQGGKLRYSYERLRPGSMVNTVLDLNDRKVERNPNNLAIEVSCIGNKYSNRCNLTFIKARFYSGGAATSTTTGGANQSLQGSEDQPLSPQSSRSDMPIPDSQRQDASGSPLPRKIGDTVEKEVTQGVGRLLRGLFK